MIRLFEDEGNGKSATCTATVVSGSTIAPAPNEVGAKSV